MPAPLKFLSVPVTPFQQNCSVACCTSSGRSAIIDPGGAVDRIRAAIAESGTAPEKIVDQLFADDGVEIAGLATSTRFDSLIKPPVIGWAISDTEREVREAKRHMERGFDQAILAEGDEDAKEIQQQLSVYIDDSPTPAEPAEGADTTVEAAESEA